MSEEDTNGCTAGTKTLEEAEAVDVELDEEACSSLTAKVSTVTLPSP